MAPPLTPSRSLSLDLAGLSGGAGNGGGSNGAEHALIMSHGLGDATDAFTLPFLDLHYFQNNAGSAAAAAAVAAAGATEPAVHADLRQGLALDLACVSTAVQTKVGAGAGAPLPRERMHQRGMSAVSPQDLLLNKAGGGGDNKRKRASWDGRSR
jgi:hypothetical protein